MKTTATETNQPGDTRDKILDAAERLFVERGFSATSLRAIANRAGVNLAATNYHFGSKMGLLAEIFHRHIGPVNDRRIANLDQLERGGQTPAVRAILQAFFQPFVERDVYATAPAVIGWLFSEPETVTRPIFEQEFITISARFQGALTAALPQLEPAELQWRFHFMIGSMIHLLRLHAPQGSEPSRISFETGLEQLINYSTAGLEQAGTGEKNA